MHYVSTLDGAYPHCCFRSSKTSFRDGVFLWGMSRAYHSIKLTKRKRIEIVSDCLWRHSVSGRQSLNKSLSTYRLMMQLICSVACFVSMASPAFYFEVSDYYSSSLACAHLRCASIYISKVYQTSFFSEYFAA